VRDSSKDQKLKHRLYFNFKRCKRRWTAMLGRSKNEREMESASTSACLEWDDKNREIEVESKTWKM